MINSNLTLCNTSRGSMKGGDRFSDLKGVMSELRRILPSKVFDKVARVEAMQALWALMDEDLRTRCVPHGINDVVENGREVKICEIYADDNLTVQVLKRDMTRMLRELAERFGRVEIEEVNYKVVSRPMLLEQMTVLRG
jgi:hypothetical protein